MIIFPSQNYSIIIVSFEDMDNPIEKIYSDLRHHYQLIFVYDLEGYKENDLTSLLLRLQAEMGLDRREKQIHEELIRKSEINVAKTLEKKARQRQEKSMKKAMSHLPEFLVQGMKEEQESEYIEQNCMIGSYPYQEEEAEYKETQRFSGNFIDGRMIILLPIAFGKEEPIQKASFEIVPEEKVSQITRATLKQCGLRLECESVALSVGCRPSEFRITEGDNNILGMSYLRNNNVITRGNYRSEQSNFTMIFTQ